MTAVSLPASARGTMQADSSASQATSSASRCCGSRRAASACENPKNSQSKYSRSAMKPPWLERSGPAGRRRTRCRANSSASAGPRRRRSRCAPAAASTRPAWRRPESGRPPRRSRSARSARPAPRSDPREPLGGELLGRGPVDVPGQSAALHQPDREAGRVQLVPALAQVGRARKGVVRVLQPRRRRSTARSTSCCGCCRWS